jgi:hypothetical protein
MNPTEFPHYETDDQGRLRKGAWIQCYSGQKFWPLDPRSEEIHYDDICVGIAREGRYRNQTVVPYSVAEHSVIVSIYCGKLAHQRGLDWLLCARQGLLHDASEAYLGDVSRPVKRQPMMSGYREAEEHLQNMIYARFGVHPTKESTDLLHEVDTRICKDEIDRLMPDPKMWPLAGRYAKVLPLGASIACLPWQQAAEAFSQRFAEVFE